MFLSSLTAKSKLHQLTIGELNKIETYMSDSKIYITFSNVAAPVYFFKKNCV